MFYCHRSHFGYKGTNKRVQYKTKKLFCFYCRAKVPSTKSKVLLFLGLLLLCSLFLYLFGLVFYLLEAFDDILNVGLVGIILDGDSLGFEICNDVLNTFLKTEVALDFLLATLAMHLGTGGEHSGFDVLGEERYAK